MATGDERERLARIEAKIDHLLDRSDRQEDDYDKLEGRVRHVETTSARHGAIYGGVMAIAISALTSLVKIKGG